MMRGLVLFLMLLLAGCSLFDRDDGDARSGEPAVWRVSKGDRQAWLFGAMHALPKQTEWRGGALDRAIRESDGLVLEILGLDTPGEIGRSFDALAISDGHPEIADRVEPDLRDRAEALADKAGLTGSSAARLESWAAAMRLNNVAAGSLGISGAYGVERVLMPVYRKADKPIEGLETATEQLSYFDRLPAAEQDAMLSAVIRDAGNARKAYFDLLNAWLAGDARHLARAAESGILLRKDVRDAVLVARNRDWAGKIDRMLGDGRQPLIAVGAAHLAGRDSVQQLLMERGYTVERVN